jgi:hypothetical protein
VLGAFMLLAGAGATRSLFDVSGRALLLRSAPAPVRARVFGLLEGASMFGLALGSILVPGLVALGGAGATLIATGLLLAGIVMVCGSRVLGFEGAEPIPASTRAALRVAG